VSKREARSRLPLAQGLYPLVTSFQVLPQPPPRDEPSVFCCLVTVRCDVFDFFHCREQEPPLLSVKLSFNCEELADQVGFLHRRISASGP